MKFLKRRNNRKVTTFWILWIAIWVVVNLVFSRFGLTLPHRIWYYLFEGVVSCLVAYLMSESRSYKLIVYAILILYLIGSINIVGITYFILNVWLAARTARICRSSRP